MKNCQSEGAGMVSYIIFWKILILPKPKSYTGRDVSWHESRSASVLPNSLQFCDSATPSVASYCGQWAGQSGPISSISYPCTANLADILRVIIIGIKLGLMRSNVCLGLQTSCLQLFVACQGRAGANAGLQFAYDLITSHRHWLVIGVRKSKFNSSLIPFLHLIFLQSAFLGANTAQWGVSNSALVSAQGSNLLVPLEQYKLQ